VGVIIWVARASSLIEMDDDSGRVNNQKAPDRSQLWLAAVLASPRSATGRPLLIPPVVVARTGSKTIG